VVSYQIGECQKGREYVQLLVALGCPVNVTNTALRPDMGKILATAADSINILISFLTSVVFTSEID
jgi:hypothetical protein